MPRQKIKQRGAPPDATSAGRTPKSGMKAFDDGVDVGSFPYADVDILSGKIGRGLGKLKDKVSRFGEESMDSYLKRKGRK